MPQRKSATSQLSGATTGPGSRFQRHRPNYLDPLKTTGRAHRRPEVHHIFVAPVNRSGVPIKTGLRNASTALLRFRNHDRDMPGGSLSRALSGSALSCSDGSLPIAFVLRAAANAQSLTIATPSSGSTAATQASAGAVNCAKLPASLQVTCSARNIAGTKCQGRMSPPDRAACLKTAVTAAMAK